MKVLASIKDRIEQDQCSKDDLMQIIEAYPRILKNKVSKQMSTLALQKLASLSDDS